MIDIPDFILTKDDNGNIVCPKCKKQEKSCTCPSIETSKNQERKAKISIQKCKKGKVITVIENLRPEKDFLKALSKELKTKIGTGGDFDIQEGQGIITLQGKQIEMVKPILKKQSISTQ